MCKHKFKRMLVLYAVMLGIGLTYVVYAQATEEDAFSTHIVLEESLSDETEVEEQQENPSEMEVDEAEKEGDSNKEQIKISGDPQTKEGLLEEDGNLFYYKNNEKESDVLISVNGQYHYFEPATYSGVMARNKWAYSPANEAWFYLDSEGILQTEVKFDGYRINGALQYDKVVDIGGYRYYFEPQAYGGVMARNKWSYSPNAKSWYSSISNGLIVRDITPGGYFVNGKKQYDAVADVLGNKYYFEPEKYYGWMATGKWSRNVRNNLWYRTDAHGVIVQVDKVGPVLPKVVKLDNGSMRVFTHYNWQRLESGCHLRAAANGLNAIGAAVTPNTIWEKLPKTNDPRTGLLGNPVVSNNWDLGGAYSAAYPSALMPIIKGYSEHSEDISRATLEQIKREIANGNPVQVYYAWVKPDIRLNSGNGTFYASKDYHSVLLTGYDQSGFYHLEAWGAIHNEYIAKWKLENQYNLMGKMAIAYRKDSLTAEATPVQN